MADTKTTRGEWRATVECGEAAIRKGKRYAYVALSRLVVVSSGGAATYLPLALVQELMSKHARRDDAPQGRSALYEAAKRGWEEAQATYAPSSEDLFEDSRTAAELEVSDAQK